MNKFRRLIQAIFAIITNAYLLFPFGPVIYQGPLKSLCTPGLHCYSCPAAVLSCPVGAFQNMLASVRLSVQAGMVHFGAVVLGYLGIYWSHDRPLSLWLALSLRPDPGFAAQDTLAKT